MELVIITGMSGAGKSRTVAFMEDIGFYCVDNMPPQLISKFVDVCAQSKGEISRIALVTDLRSGETFFRDFMNQLDQLGHDVLTYRLLFLDCADKTLMTRYKETRRKHPLISLADNSLEKAIRLERRLLSNAKARSDYVIDTSHLSPAQLKERITEIFLGDSSGGMMINCISFGFKYGFPADADLVFDVRCLPNPFYIESLKNKTGLDKEVFDYVMESPAADKLFEKIYDLLEFSIPLYIKETKSQLTIAFGCTGGKHRSVTFAEKMYGRLSGHGNKVTVTHRDIMKF